LSIDAGWGERREELVTKISKQGKDASNYENIKVGTQLRLTNGMEALVTNVTAHDFTIDLNPPLAGTSYKVDLTLKSVEVGPSIDKFSYHEVPVIDDSKYVVATFAMGCFWGVELEYMRLEGVVGTKVGYTQGHKENPTYDEVCAETTGHTEAVQIIFDPDIISFKQLVTVGIERLGDDKYQLNQVGNDWGTQYRHGIYYHDDLQKKEAEMILQNFGDKCCTECLPAAVFWEAEEYHQQYLFKGGQSARKGEKKAINCYG